MLEFLQHSLQTAREKHVHQGHGYRVRAAMDFLKPRWRDNGERPHPGVQKYPYPLPLCAEFTADWETPDLLNIFAMPPHLRSSLNRMPPHPRLRTTFPRVYPYLCIMLKQVKASLHTLCSFWSLLVATPRSASRWRWHLTFRSSGSQRTKACLSRHCAGSDACEISLQSTGTQGTTTPHFCRGGGWNSERFN